MFKTSSPKILLAISFMAFSTSVLSNEISYDFVQGAYSAVTDSSQAEDWDAEGLAVGGSVDVLPNLAITASYGLTKFDEILGLDFEFTAFDIGVTAHTSVAPGTDVFGNLSIVNAEIEISDGFGSVSEDDTGNLITIGLLHMVNDNVELSAAFSRADIFDDTGNSFGVGARVYVDDKLSIGLGYNTGDDVEALSLSARIDFK